MKEYAGIGVGERRQRRSRMLLGLLVLALSLLTRSTPAEEPLSEAQAEAIATYRSGQIELNTDLRSEDAKALLTRLQSTLRRVSQYWRRPLGRRIICYVADDLANWPDALLPHPQARLVLQHVGGGTELRTVRHDESKDPSLVAHVYATSIQGIAEHEVVHAYCLLAFGTCGPEWYKEGMAEMAFHYGKHRESVTCPVDVSRMLRGDRAKTIDEIIGAGEFTRPIASRFKEMRDVDDGVDPDLGIWRIRDNDIVDKARQSYHRSWALCYFLANNPNYQERFRQLGIHYLNRIDADFHEVFGPDAEKLAFEFGLFLKEIDDGYRVDLCRWNWNREFAELGDGEVKSVRILAAQGYQPSGLIVSANETYDYVAKGRWTACRHHAPVTADGNYLGSGCLEGAIVTDYTLGEPIQLGTRGSFVAQRTGKLYLRCRDAWHALGDNEGEMEVHLRMGGTGTIEPAP